MTGQTETPSHSGAGGIWRRAVRVVADLVLLGLCVATAMTWLGRFWWVADLASHFSVYYAVISLVLLAVSLGMRRWRVAGVAVLLLVMHVWTVFPAFNPGPVVVKAPGPRIRLAQVNLLHKNRDKESALAFIRGCGADVVILQEVDPWWDRVFESADLPYRLVVSHPVDHSFGIAMLAQDPPGEYSSVRVEGALVLHETDGFDRPTIEASLDVDGRRVALLSIHPPPPVSASYAAQRNQILRQAKAWAGRQTEPHIIIGDLNTTPWSHAFSILTDDGKLRSSHDGRGNQGTWPTRLPMPWLLPIDHCLFSEGLVCLDRRIGEPIGSDHLPLLVELGFTGGSP